MLKFFHPEYLLLLWALPVLAAVWIGLLFWRKKLIARFVSRTMAVSLSPDASLLKRIFKQVLLLLALASMIAAVANPQVGTQLEEVKRKGIDLFVVMDVSLSMKCEDIKPSRMEKAKRDVSTLLKKLQGDRVGLIVFAGEAFIQFPLTADYSAADLFLSAVDVDAVPVPGTMIGNAIDLALESFPKDKPTQKAIVIVSDGENTEGDVLSAVERAKTQNVKIYSIGQGTLEGGPIPVYQGGVQSDYKRERGGSIVLTKLDETMLQQIAAATGGTYRRATSAGNEIDEIFKELSSIEKTDFGALQVSGFEDRFQYPLFFGILLLILEVILSERRGKMLTRLIRFFPKKGSLVTGFLVVLATTSVEAQTVRNHVAKGNAAYKNEKFSDAEAEYKKALEKDAASRAAKFNLGNAEYKQQRYDEALRNYQAYGATTKDAKEQAAAYYNLGNTLLKANKLPESIEAYKQSLRKNPNDEDTRYNLQYALQMMKQQQQQKQQQKQDQKQDQQKQQNKQQQQPQQQQQKSASDQTKQQEMQQKKEKMQKEEAERILQALRNNEKDIQKNLRKRVGGRYKTEKDW